MRTLTGQLTSDALNQLLSRARSVTEPSIGQPARDAANGLLNAVRAVANQYGAEEMRRACAWLAVNPWPSKPTDACHVTILAAARTVVARAGEANTRDALAFWAAEHDPAVWQAVLVAA